MIFLAHGSPFLLDDRGWMAELGAWAGDAAAEGRAHALGALGGPAGHRRRDPLRCRCSTTSTASRPSYYQTTYPAPPAPELAARVRQLLPAEPVADAPERGPRPRRVRAARLHVPGGRRAGAAGLAPDARPDRAARARPRARAAARGGRAHRRQRLPHPQPARDELRARRPDAGLGVGVRRWTKDVLERRDVDALLDYRTRAPGRAPVAADARALRPGDRRDGRRDRRQQPRR